MKRQTWSATVLMLGVLVVAAVATACGGSDGGQEVASLGGGDNASAATTDDGGGDDGQPTDEEAEEAMLEFTQCMREHGVDMPDPDTSGGGGAVMIGPGSEEGEELDMDAFEEADEACRHLIEDVMGAPQEMSPEEQAEMQDQMLAHAQCMREHGVDMPDPEFSSEGGGGMVSQELGEGIDPMSEEFAEAQEACADELGGEGGIFGGPAVDVEGAEAPGDGPSVVINGAGATSAESDK